MRKHDLSRRAPPAGSRTSSHVSNSSQKAALRALLLDERVGVAPELKRLRARLDYAAPNGEARAGEPEHERRRWRLASLAEPSR